MHSRTNRTFLSVCFFSHSRIPDSDIPAQSPVTQSVVPTPSFSPANLRSTPVPFGRWIPSFMRHNNQASHVSASHSGEWHGLCLSTFRVSDVPTGFGNIDHNRGGNGTIMPFNPATPQRSEGLFLNFATTPHPQPTPVLKTPDSSGRRKKDLSSKSPGNVLETESEQALAERRRREVLTAKKVELFAKGRRLTPKASVLKAILEASASDLEHGKGKFSQGHTHVIEPFRFCLLSTSRMTLI